MSLTWLATVLRDAGLEVGEMDGWRTRGRTDISVNGVVCHHTATPPSASDAAVDRLLRDGRSDLPGPLSQLGLRRDGSFVVVAAGRCNHNGYGTWGNDSIGIEAYNDGRGEPWPDIQLDAYARGCAALIQHLGLSIAQVRGHKETDPGRKIDPLFDMDAFRAQVDAVLHPPVPGDPEEDDDMAYLLTAPGKATRLVDGLTSIGVSQDTAADAKKAGVKVVTVTAKEYDSHVAQVTKLLG